MENIVILAGNYREFSEYVFSHEHELRGYTPIYGDARSMAGTRYSEFLVVGTFWDRSDANEAYEFAKARETPNTPSK